MRQPQLLLFLFLYLSVLGVWGQAITPSTPTLSDSALSDRLFANETSDTIASTAKVAKEAVPVQDSLKKKVLFARKEEKVVEIDTATIDMYKIYQEGKPAVFVDTTLTIQKEYKFNFLRKDYFELLPFVNMGHAFNRLGHDFTQGTRQPQMGAKSKHFSYFQIEDINYYRVPTPLTELFFKTTLEQGQLSDATITINTSPQFNFAIAYRGMRSLGKYINQRSANEVFRLSLTYQTVNERYKAKAHYASQELINQEYGGITDQDLQLFESGDPDFIERSVLNVRLKNAENTLKGKRSFFQHNYSLLESKDTTATRWTLGHQIMNETKFFKYSDSSRSDYFGPQVAEEQIDDQVHWAIVKNRFETSLANPRLGELTAGLEYSKIDYFYRLEEESATDELPQEPSFAVTSPLSLTAKQSFLNADYKFNWRGFDFLAHFNKTLLSDFLSDDISLKAKITLKNSMFFEGKASFINKSPDFNFLRYRSSYAYYNWYNPSLGNEKITSLSATLSHPKWGSLSGLLQRLENFTYYNQIFSETSSETTTTPDLMRTEVVQSTSAITYFKVRYQSHYQFRKFGLTTTAQYQNVSSEGSTEASSSAQIINVPEWNVRSTLSFSSDLFKKALFIQAGITGHYFTRYYADQYNPLLGDFMRQDRQTIGNFPRIDLFVNGKIKQTRIYFKYEHVNSTLTGYNFYSAVGYPYRDRILRFGVVWNFFQ